MDYLLDLLIAASSVNEPPLGFVDEVL